MTATTLPVPAAAKLRIERNRKQLVNFPHNVVDAAGNLLERNMRVVLADGRQATVTRVEVNSQRVCLVVDHGPTLPNGYLSRSAKRVTVIKDHGRVIKSATKTAERLAAEALAAAAVENDGEA